MRCSRLLLVKCNKYLRNGTFFGHFLCNNHLSISPQDPRGHGGNHGPPWRSEGPGHTRSHSYGDVGEATRSNRQLVRQHLASECLYALDSRVCTHVFVCLCVCVCLFVCCIQIRPLLKAGASNSNTQWGHNILHWRSCPDWRTKCQLSVLAFFVFALTFAVK